MTFRRWGSFSTFSTFATTLNARALLVLVPQAKNNLYYNPASFLIVSSPDVGIQARSRRIELSVSCSSGASRLTSGILWTSLGLGLVMSLRRCVLGAGQAGGRARGSSTVRIFWLCVPMGPTGARFLVISDSVGQRESECV